MEMKNVGGHIEVYDGGKFILSADNLREAEKELEETEGVIKHEKDNARTTASKSMPMRRGHNLQMEVLQRKRMQ